MMTADANADRTLTSVCEPLIKAAGKPCKWEWDDYSSAVLTVLGKTDLEPVRALLGRAFVLRFDAVSIGGAPPAIGALAKRTGGLRKGQELFASGAGPGTVVYATWWPWGDLQHVSVRVSSTAVGGTDRDAEGLVALLRRSFGL
ncbi:MAG: hypothetical protein HY903_02050 [Deltaproteobacteria bacterium]|nr:hypothetical protein [Deltaproteobacteria bacterium]